MLILKASDVEALLARDVCMDLMANALQRVSEGSAVVPLRQFMSVPDTPGRLGLMPGYLPDPPCFGVKVVSKYPRALDGRHGSHLGAVLLFDAKEGLPLALIDGGMLTALRTAATSALATRVLATEGARILLICGTGEEARHHALAVSRVRAFERVLVWGRSTARGAALISGIEELLPIDCVLAPDLEAAVRRADVICTTTAAAEPFLRGNWLQPGAHLNLVGSAVAHTAEVDIEAVRRARYFVDYRAAALQQAGELRSAIERGLVDETHVVAELGEVLLGTAPGRRAADEITVYKSLGLSAQDLAAAYHVYEQARALNVGMQLELHE